MGEATRMHKQSAKRLMDLVIASLGLVLVSPLLLLLYLWIRLDSGGAVLFRQVRVGQGGRRFVLLKFRSMVAGAPDLRNQDGSTFNADDDPRLTRVGRFLRRTSLDELPQLLNVLQGDMSLVGPRPDLPDQVHYYTERQRKRLLVKPGLTGWAVVNGRNGLTWEERRELDVEYVERFSIWLDLQILLRTVALVLRGKGLYITKPPRLPNSEPNDARG